MTPLEIEVKFFLTRINAVEHQIQNLGAEFRDSRDETNIRYESGNEDLMRSKSLLRLRRAGQQTILTFKSEAPEPQSDYKIHREYEVSVDDFRMMQNILESLGYHQAQVYEKNRRTYQWGTSLLCLDTMPYGCFLEIEGPGPEIRDLAEKLALSWDSRILMNYLEMFERIRAALGLPFNDVTFANFRSVPMEPVSELIQGFTAGGGGSA